MSDDRGELPTRIGKYRVIRKLGQGGMGAVYEAEGEGGVRVALKVLMTELARNATHMGRFQREATAAAEIDTPHIAKVIEAGSDEATGLPFIVMELLEGEDLQQLLRRTGPLPPDVALRIVAQACVALDKAHAARIIHRDIKPANLFLAKQPGGERIVKLVDFGVAKVRPDPTRSQAETKGLTRTGSMLGSPLYMSPEQARGYKDIDHRSDLFSLGVVLYQALSGRTPHEDTEELGELIILICTEAPMPLQEVAPWVPAEVAKIVHRALRLDAVERFRGAAEMLAEVTALLPWGSAISEKMLHGLSDADREKVAPRLTTSLADAPPPPKRGERSIAHATTGGEAASAATPPPETRAAPVAESPLGTSAASPGALGSITSGTAKSVATDGAPAGKSRAPLVGAALVLAAAVAGVAIYRGVKPAPMPEVPVATVSTRVDSKPRSVKLVIIPPSAAVEVDGAPAKADDGLVEILGELGSVHKVRVSAEGVERRAEIVVTENGASPPKIDLGIAARPAASDAPTGSASAAVPAVATTRSGTKPPPHPPVFRDNR